MEINLTQTTLDYLKLLFHFQLDKDAIHLAAFTNKDSKDEIAYVERYSKYLTDPSINMLTIKVNNIVVGSISKFVMENEPEITYWIDRKFWGRGIASNALK